MFSLNRNTIQKVKEGQPMIMSLLKTDTLLFDPLMVMCQHMVTTHTPVSQAMDTTTTVMWPMIEDIHHPGMLTCRRVLKRREIETTNPLGISIQVRHLNLEYNTSVKHLSYIFKRFFTIFCNVAYLVSDLWL